MSEEPADFFDIIGEHDKRPKRAAPVRQPSNQGLNLAPTIADPRTRGAVRRALELSFENITTARARGIGRNDMLNTEGFNLGQLIENRLLTEPQVVNHLMDAAIASGLYAEDGEGQCMATIMSGVSNGRASGPRTNLPQMGAPNVQVVTDLPGVPDQPGASPGEAWTPPTSGPGPGARIVKLKRFSDLEERQPTWAWHYNGYGRIQVNTLSIFGGPPGTGKSTAARWFAAEATNGTLTGHWHGEPINVAYIAVEEDLDAMVKPSLRAAGADMNRLFYPEVIMDGSERIISSVADEIALTDELLDNDIRMLVVDPIMSTLGAGTDIHKNNEVREAIQPFVNIAGKINGLVIGICHYRKSGAASGVAAITGSSAFGEVARSVFGFMKGGMDADEPRVMSQSKNSAGREDLALQYALDLTPVLYDDGGTAEMTRFKILGDSDVTVEDLMAEGGQARTKVSDAKEWLYDYLLQNGPTDNKKVKQEGKTAADFSDDTLYRAARKLKVIFTNTSLAGKPRVTVWALPIDSSFDHFDGRPDDDD